MKLYVFFKKCVLVVSLIALFVQCSDQNAIVSSDEKSGLKIPVASNINGSIVKEMIGVDITHKATNSKMNKVTGIEDQYLVDDFNHDGSTDVAVRRGSLIIIDTNRDGVSDLAFSFGNGNSERGYYTTNGGIAVVRDYNIYIDDNLDGLADRSFQFGNGNSESQYIFLYGGGVAVRRLDYGVENHIIVDSDMDGIANNDFYFGNGSSEDQYSHGINSVSGWCVRRNNAWYTYGSQYAYTFGNGNSENGYFWSNLACFVLRGNTLYYDSNYDGVADGNFSFGTGL